MNRLVKIIGNFFKTANVSDSFSIGARGKDGFAPFIRNGVETNCRIYIWDKADVDELMAIGRKLQNKNIQ